jgi:two-component system cell cycle sensor histidine kinase/response regulator CckA
MNQQRGNGQAPRAAETILVVEDEELLLELVQSLLESHGYTVLTARDGLSAVELFKQHSEQIALVLTDLGLPKLDGGRASAQMKAINPKLKVIVATGYLDPEARGEMLQAGIHEFVHKPYFAAEILEKVKGMLKDNSG